MTAPALVMVAHGSTDPRVARLAHALRAELHAARPQIAAHVGFLENVGPTVAQLLSRLSAQGVSEAVLVPLELCHAVDVDPRFDSLMAASRVDQPGLAVAVSRPVGPEAALLALLDARLRTALAAARVLELDGLVLSSATTGDVRGAALLARRARQWSTHHRLPCLTAVADGTGPSVAQAFAGLRSQGRRHIAVGSFFLGPDESYAVQADLAYRVGAVAVSEPLGTAAEVAELVLARYAFAAMDLLDSHESGAHGSVHTSEPAVQVLSA